MILVMNDCGKATALLHKKWYLTKFIRYYKSVIHILRDRINTTARYEMHIPGIS